MNYAKIKWHDISNGPGVRASLFVSGCTHGCPNCFNQEAWDFDYGKPWTQEIEDEFIKHLQKKEIVGVNILGGEPLQQDITLLKIIARTVVEVQKPIWLWTGYVITDELLNNHLIYEILTLCDVVVDGRFVEAKKDLSLKYRGSSNQRVIDIKKTLTNMHLEMGYAFLSEKYFVEAEGC